VGKAPVEGDTTIMGAGSVHHAVPAMAQRGKAKSTGPCHTGRDLSFAQLLFKFEKQDGEFRMRVRATLGALKVWFSS
jgi:hypothetical protein